jgi:mannose-6-phosphate isomerase-like protein (cupin superfamily)
MRISRHLLLKGARAEGMAKSPRLLAKQGLARSSASRASLGPIEIWEFVMGPNVPRKVNLREKLDVFTDHWAPKIVARYNGNEVRLVRAKGEWVWHKHDETDELFLILDGLFDMDFRDGTITVGPGELLLVPRGTEHRPAARRGEVKLLLLDPEGTPNTGNAETATQTVEL